jgi:hypothetical protein
MELCKVTPCGHSVSTTRVNWMCNNRVQRVCVCVCVCVCGGGGWEVRLGRDQCTSGMLQSTTRCKFYNYFIVGFIIKVNHFPFVLFIGSIRSGFLKRTAKGLGAKRS